VVWKLQLKDKHANSRATRALVSGMSQKIKFSARRLLYAVLLLVCAIVILGVAAPLVNVSRFSGAIQRKIEASLGRQVHFSAAHLTLLTGAGFSLEDVTIQEDPHYGLEPFAHAAGLQAHLRMDKLLRGQIQLSSLRLVEPSLNLVKDREGAWNIVGLLARVSAPRRPPLNLFPAFEISDGRVNFKLGSRKTTLYITDADLSVYPERSGKLYLRFSGSPARTDRAGNGFGHVHGSANWYLAPATRDANQLEANVSIEASNLSEFATLLEGYDVGVHGTVSSQMRIEGPATALRISGQLRLADVHRWDLLPSSGEDWRIGYTGSIDLSQHTLQLETAPEHGAAEPIALRLRIRDFLTHPAWALLAQFTNAPAQQLLPLARRMGLAIPGELRLQGAIDGAVSYSKASGFEGGILMKDVAAAVPGLPSLRTTLAIASVSSDHIHLEPAVVETSSGGTLRAGGDYYFSSERLVAGLSTSEFALDALTRAAVAWSGMPPALAFVRHGIISGALTYTREAHTTSSWSGQFQFNDATVGAPALAVALDQAQGRVTFDNSTLNLDHFSGRWGQQIVSASYHYNAAAKHPERLHVEIPSADLTELETALDPTLRAQSLLARLHFTRRSIPGWLAERNLDGDLRIGQFAVDGVELGPLATRFTWRGANLNFGSAQLNLPEGLIRARGGLNLGADAPAWSFTATATGFAWRRGLLSAEGDFHTSGTGLESLRNLRAAGTFSADDIQLSGEDSFDTVSGNFDFSFADGWPNLRLSNIEADDGEDAWNGQAASQSDGRLVVDLEHDGHQRRVISTLAPSGPQPATLTSRTIPQ
jgi:hypothetical protein